MRDFDFTPFRAEVKKQIVLQHIADYKAIAQDTGYSFRTIEAFMCGIRNGTKVAMAIKNALKITENFGFEPKE